MRRGAGGDVGGVALQAPWWPKQRQEVSPSAVGDKKITLRVADLTELLSKQLPSPRLNSKAVGISVVGEV